jgi:hypothetical protein
MNDQIFCTRCGAVNAPSARFCQQCGNRLLGPAGAKGSPTDANQPQQPVPPQQTGRTGQASPNWNQTMLGGLAGFILGSMFGGGRGFFGGRDFDGGDFDGGGFGGGGFGGGGFGGGDFGGGDFGG